MFNRIVSVDAKTVLFGSRVRGEARQDSDWNVLVSFGKGFLLSAIATWLSVMPLQSCLGDVRDAKPPAAPPTQVQSTQRWTRLDLSRITFNDDISFLSPDEQTLYRKYQSEFLQSLKRLSPQKQKEMNAVYKWVPDVIKIIASRRDYKDRKRYEKIYPGGGLRSGTRKSKRGLPYCPGTELYDSIKHELYQKLYKRKSEIPNPRGLFYVIDICREMVQFRYPVQMIDTKDQSIEDTVKKCGFAYLSGMVDFCDDPQNHGKSYRGTVDRLTYDKTLEEMEAFENIGSRYEPVIWEDFKKRSYSYIYKFWRFDLKKVDTSNLTPKEYAKMEKQLKCIPPEILIASRVKQCYNLRNYAAKSDKTLNTTYIKKYAKKKGFYLSDTEVNEVYQLASELVKYGTPLKLVKRDDQADLYTVARSFGFHRVAGFDGYYKRKKKNNLKVKFYESVPEKIPLFTTQAKDFYDLGMIVNPEKTKKLYQNIENDTGIIIRHSGTQSGQMGADSRPQP